MTYPYECPNCGQFTVDRSIKDEPLKTCPTCEAPVQRIFTATPSVVKCSGFFGKSK